MRPGFILATFIILLITGACGKGKAQIDTEILVPSQAVAVPSQMDALPAATGEELAIARRELESLDIPDGLGSDTWQQICGALIESLQARGISKLPNESRNVIDDLQWIDNGGGDFNLEWTLRNAGDYDNNGEVNVSDLSAIGVHFGKNESSSSWATARTADGDGNGEINIADVSPIGVNFGSQVLGYNVYASDYEDGPWLLQGSIELADATTGFPLRFSYAYGAQEHAFVTVAPFDNSGNDTVAASGGTAAKYIPGTTTEQSSQAIDEAGGQLVGSGNLDGVIVDIPAGALDRPETISLGSNDGMILPVVGTWGGLIIDISGEDHILFDEPLVITAPFTGDPDQVPIPYYIREDGQLEACMLMDLDRGNGTFSFATEHATKFAWITSEPSDYKGSYVVESFSPLKYGFQIGNWGSQYSLSGECLGMISFSQWYFRFASPKPDFYPLFMEVLDYDHLDFPLYGQNIIATRAFNSMADAQLRWLRYRPDIVEFSEQLVLIKNELITTGEPVHVGLSEDNYVKNHAVLAYGYTEDQLLIYDPNFPGDLPFINISEDGFFYAGGPDWTQMYHIGIGTVVRENFSNILQDAQGGFTGSQDALIDSLNYSNGDIVTTDEITLTGKVSSSELLIERLKIYTGYSEHEAKVSSLNGGFTIKLPIKDGDNYFFFRTEGRDGVNNWIEANNNFAFNRGLYIVGEYKPEKLRITLTWDQNNSFGMNVKDPSGETLFGNRMANPGMDLVSAAGGYFEGTYESGGPLHFVIPADGTLLPGSFQFVVRNTSTLEEYGVVEANWQVLISFNEGEPLVRKSRIEKGNVELDPEWGPYFSAWQHIFFDGETAK
ncbi:MAG: hypothetical protein H7A35_02200 [Planctomycetales bacterium]|nr:hypothetical protein [bacterium]UNM08871.1 MAG: hypothetical protein H7A35_02200 [Planctomycetales bacterium]